MSAKGFTPGPWRIGTPGPNGCATIGTERGLMTAVIAHSLNEPSQAETAKANARLIASAPTLLEALALAASKPLWQHCTDEEWEFIRGAILGAQGEQV